MDMELDDEKEKFFIAEGMFLGGLSIRFIASELALNRKVISFYLKEKGYIITAKTGNSDYNKRILFEKAKKEYLNGASIRTLAKKYGFSRQSFSYYLKDEGIKVSATVSSLYETSEGRRILDEAIDLYKKGVSLQEIKKLISIDGSLLADELRKIGIDTIKRSKKYNVNKNVFKVIDSPEKAYWLGLFYADAYVSTKRGYVFQLSLKKEDFEHLVLLKNFISTDVELTRKEINLEGKTFVYIVFFTSFYWSNLLSANLKCT